MNNMTIYEKLNLINNNTNLIKQILVEHGFLTADEATLENLPPMILELISQIDYYNEKLIVLTQRIEEVVEEQEQVVIDEEEVYYDPGNENLII